MSTPVTLHSNARRTGRPPRRRRLLGLWSLVLLLALLLAVGGYFVFSFPKAVPKLNYPLAYRDQIALHAEEFGLDPARVAAVVYCESSFRPDAVSPVGARGLMQIMPKTGEWLAEKLKIEGYTVDLLFEPEINLRMGCWYLSYLDQRFGGDLETATAAYHTGQGNVDKWLTDTENSKDGATLDAIPSSVTDSYVKKVRYAYEEYKELYIDEPESQTT